MIIILLGPPGSGKGTQGTLLSEKFGFPYIVAGDIMREKSKHDPDVKSILDSGKLLPSDYVNKFVGAAIENCLKSDISLRMNGDDEAANAINYVPNRFCIVDGYPRTLAQAEYLEKHYRSYEIFVLYFRVDDATLISRLSNRIACAECGNIQSGSVNDFVCLKCRSRAYSRRKDDDLHVIEARIREYRKNTEPLIDFYTKSNIISIIDAQKNVSEIQSELLAVLSQKVYGFSKLVELLK